MQTIDSREILTDENLLSWAIHEAATSHYGDLDKGGQPYILHPLRVMMQMRTLDEKIVAVLHDVVEDGGMLESTLREYVGRTKADAIMALTHKKGETYSDYIQRVGKNGLARKVKMEDLKDNMNLNRLPEITEVDTKRFIKYANALNELRKIEEDSLGL